MELSLLISVVSLIGFAGALSYNVYEFRKVGKSLDAMIEGLNNMNTRTAEDHERMIESLNNMNARMAEDHERIAKILERTEKRLSAR